MSAYIVPRLTISPVSILGLGWHVWDTWIVITGMLAAMSCTLPGVWLVLRQHSMMGDALSHTALPGVILSFLFGQFLLSTGWLTESGLLATEPLFLVVGAVLIGVLTAILTESVQKLGQVEANAALGVVFTSLFALGLLLIRLFADDIHLDPDCVLFGQLELAVWETVPVFGLQVPTAVLANGSLLMLNSLLLMLFFKELRLAAFDPAHAVASGINAGWIHYLSMGMTAATVVIAFTSVGSILVVAILIVPAASSLLICTHLPTMIGTSLLIAAASAGLGHLLAKTLPSLIFTPLGLNEIQDAGTPGMMAVACGMIFFILFLFSPQSGLVGRWLSRMTLTLKMAMDDILATLYRFEESPAAGGTSVQDVRRKTSWIPRFTWMIALSRLKQRGLVSGVDLLRLTSSGVEQASLLLRSHRLWESYLHKHFQLDSGTHHESADRVEHFLDHDLQSQLDAELDSPHIDPQGKSIPAGEKSSQPDQNPPTS